MTRLTRIAACAVALAWSTIAYADEDERGGIGESCRARSDCIHGLHCIANVCTDQHAGEACATKDDCGLLDCVAGHCGAATSATTTATPPPPPPPIARPLAPPPPLSSIITPPTPPTPRPPTTRRDGAWRAFVGVTALGGFLTGGYSASEGTRWGNGLDASALFALRAGILSSRHELALEISPGLAFWDLTIARGPAFEANASYAYLLGLGGMRTHLAWPLRIGLGVLAGGQNTGSNVFFEVRLDLIGLRWQTAHWALDLHAPSFRYAVTNSHVAGVAVEGVTTNLLSFLFGASVSYIF